MKKDCKTHFAGLVSFGSVAKRKSLGLLMIKFSSIRITLSFLTLLSLIFIGLPVPTKVAAQKSGTKYISESPEVVPTSPPGCTAAAANFANTTPVTIIDAGVVTSTITVSGANPYLWDVDLQTFIQHTFSADLDITIQSPAGTVVTLTTDNGAGNDDVFNGTLFDDDANPGGQVPYTTNNGVTTDNLYTNLVTATPLTPEEPLAAFLGENPNGVWTLTISDDLAGDGGTLNSWNLNITTFPRAPTELTNSFSNTTPVTIPTGPAVVTSTINVSGLMNVITKTTLQTFIQHTFSADLDITIQSPAGTVVTLTTDNGAGNDDVFNGTLFDDDANPGGQVPYTTNNGVTTDNLYTNLVTATPLTPEEPLAAFLGENPNGVWTLTISDDLAGDGGTLNSWNLNINTGSCTVTAAGAEVSGRVASPGGRPISGALISLTDLQGNTRTTRVSSFGYFKFEEVIVGQTYIINVNARRYQFTPQVITVNNNLTGLILLPQP